MTSYMVDYLWRLINLTLHQLDYLYISLYVTWPKSRDVISVRYHVIKLITPENPGNELASFLEKNPDAFGNVWERHFWKNYPFSSISIILITFLKKKTNFGKWVSVIPGKKIQTTFQVWIYFPEMTLTHFPKNIFFKNSWPYIQEKSLDFFPEMTLTHFPKSDFWNFGWIFFPRMTLTHFPAFGFFFQDSQIDVNLHSKKSQNR